MPTVNLNEMTFGIEIECLVPATTAAVNGIRVGNRHRGIQVPGLPDGWKAEADGSIRADDRTVGFVPMEIVSPKLRGPEGLAQVVAVYAKLNAWGFAVNKTCGMHVHVGFNYDGRCPIMHAALKRLVHLVAGMEDVLWANSGKVNRAANRSYCAPISDSFSRANWTSIDTLKSGPASSRMSSLNLTNILFESTKRTVEFRAFCGTTRVIRAITAIRIALAFVQRALMTSRCGAWQPKVIGGRTPANIVKHFLMTSGWWEMARFPVAYGMLMCEGAPTKEESVRFLRREARHNAIARGITQAARPVAQPAAPAPAAPAVMSRPQAMPGTDAASVTIHTLSVTLARA